MCSLLPPHHRNLYFEKYNKFSNYINLFTNWNLADFINEIILTLYSIFCSQFYFIRCDLNYINTQFYASSYSFV